MEEEEYVRNYEREEDKEEEDEKANDSKVKDVVLDVEKTLIIRKSMGERSDEHGCTGDDIRDGAAAETRTAAMTMTQLDVPPHDAGRI